MAKKSPVPKEDTAVLTARLKALSERVDADEVILLARITTIEAAEARLQKIEAVVGVNPPATGEKIERTVLSRLDVLDRKMESVVRPGTFVQPDKQPD